MDHPLLPVADWFLSLPDISCPTCARGLLHKTGDFNTHRSGESRQAEHEDPEGFEPDWVVGVFIGILSCATPGCWESVAVAGNFETVDNPDRRAKEQWMERYRLTYLRPAPQIVACPPQTPLAVRSAAEAAAAVIWIDAPGAGNRLRVAVEELLTHQRIPLGTLVTKQNRPAKKRVRLTTHARIELFAVRDPDVAEVLLAIKWLGNAGSHESGMSVEDVLEAAQMLSHALRLLYDPSDADLRRRAALINKRKGPAPRQAARRSSR